MNCFILFWHHLFMHIRMALSKCFNLYTTPHALTYWERPTLLTFDLEWTIDSHDLLVLSGVMIKKVLNPTSTANEKDVWCKRYIFLGNLRWNIQLCIHRPHKHQLSYCCSIEREGWVRLDRVHLVSFTWHHFHFDTNSFVL